MAAKQRLADSIGMANEEIVTEAISIIQATTSVQVSADDDGARCPLRIPFSDAPPCARALRTATKSRSTLTRCHHAPSGSSTSSSSRASAGRSTSRSKRSNLGRRLAAGVVRSGARVELAVARIMRRRAGRAEEVPRRNGSSSCSNNWVRLTKARMMIMVSFARELRVFPSKVYTRRTG